MLYVAEFQIILSCAAHYSSWAEFVTLPDTQAGNNDGDLFTYVHLKGK